MKNALLYCVNDNDYQICRMINSINSFAYYNQNILNGLDVYIITDSEVGINLNQVDKSVNVHMINNTHYDYSKLSTGYRKNWSFHVYFRWELFINPLFLDVDNLLYMDNDTEFVSSVEELFVERTNPQILLVQENVNHVNDELGKHVISKYYNSGVMLITPKLFGRELLQTAFHKLIECAKSRNWKWPNQDPTNFVLGHEPFRKFVVGISQKFNYFNTTQTGCKLNGDPAILHHVNGAHYDKKFLRKPFINLHLRDFCQEKIPLNLHQAALSKCPLGNAAIIPYKGGYLCAFREFDHYYLTKDFFRYTDRLSSKSELFFAFLDNNFNILSDKSRFNGFDINYGNFKSRDNILHDPRLFEWDKKLFMSASMFIRPFSVNKFKMGVYELNDMDWKMKLTLVHDSRNSTGSASHQKNWMAVPGQFGKMVVQVRHDGVEVVDIGSNKKFQVLSDIDLGCSWNGGAIFQMDDNWMIALVHRYGKCKTGRNYFHKFLVMDKKLKIVHASREFKFDDVFPIEFATSIFQTIDNPDTLGITVCENDAFQYVYLIDKWKLWQLIGWEDCKANGSTRRNVKHENPKRKKVQYHPIQQINTNKSNGNFMFG